MATPVPVVSSTDPSPPTASSFQPTQATNAPQTEGPSSSQEPPVASPPPPPAPQNAKTISTVASTTTVAATAASGGAASGEVSSLQTLLILGLSDCSSHDMADMSSSMKDTLLPFRRAFQDMDLESKDLLSSVAGLLLVGSLHVIVLLVGHFVMIKTPTESFLDAAALVRFPSLTGMVFNLLYQGMAIETLQIVLDPIRKERANTTDKAICGVSGFILIAIPMVMMSTAKKVTAKTSFRHYTHQTSKTSAIMRMFVLPTGFWDSQSLHMRCIGSFGSWIASSDYWRHIPTLHLRCLCMALVVAVPSDQLSCEMKPVVLAALIMLITTIGVWRRAQRTRLSLSVSTVLNIITAVTALSVMSSVASENLGPQLVTASSVITALSGVGMLYMRLRLEKKWRKEVRLLDESPSLTLPILPANTTQTSSDDEEMSSLSTTSSNSSSDDEVKNPLKP